MLGSMCAARRLLLLGCLVDEGLVNVGNNTTSSNGSLRSRIESSGTDCEPPHEVCPYVQPLHLHAACWRSKVEGASSEEIAALAYVQLQNLDGC